MNNKIKIHVLHTGKVRVSPYLPYGGDNCSLLKASGITTPKNKRIWLPVSAYYIEHPKGKILVDTGWHRDMSPNGVYDKKAQIKSLGSRLLFKVNQGMVEKEKTVSEQLEKLGVKASDLDYVILTHLDCDHVNGLNQVKDAKKIIVSNDEIKCTNKKKISIKIRYQKKWWKDTHLKGFEWNGTEGAYGKSYDLFEDGSVVCISIPGHSDGQCAVKITGKNGKYVLLFADGGYSTKSWMKMITSGISMNKEEQRKSLEWIREQSLNKNCLESLGNHDPDVVEHSIIL